MIVALGHEGATAGTLHRSHGPLIDLADGAVNVDAVIGDHNDLQVDSLRSNGVLVTENRGKGLRFTRIRLVVGTGKDGVVYKTADLPQAVGHRADPRSSDPGRDRRAERGARADPRTRRSGSRPKPIPRADQCGNDVGRLCESLVGNVVTDAMRERTSRLASSSRSPTRAVSGPT